MKTQANGASLSTALAFLREAIHGRFRVHTGQAESVDLKGLAYLEDGSPFAAFMGQHQPSFEEYIVILLALAPALQPNFYTRIMEELLPQGGDFIEFGGARGLDHRGILPTGETAQFVLAGDDLEKRLEVQALFRTDHWLAKKNVLALSTVREHEPPMSGRLMLDPEILELLTLGSVSKPRFSTEFPAEHIETAMEWEDLVLHDGTLRQIHEIEHWIRHQHTLMNGWGMARRVKPGYRALFYGPPGTGKTLTATLLGKYTGKDVFRIDLSRVISKYIGETEKNLARLFDKAEHKDWILFFDEADALFGKRTEIRDAHDKYANQEVAYLLQRVESYHGLVILATNQRSNIDDAFVRRFQSIVHFPIPGPAERRQIWEKAFPEQIEVKEEVDWARIAERFELTGAGIMNVAHFCAIEALADETCQVDCKRIEQAIRREYIKEGRIG